MIFTLVAHPYNVDVTFILGEGNARIDDYLRRAKQCDEQLIDSILEALESGHSTQGRCLHLSNGAIVVYLKAVPMGSAGIGLLTHELYHATCYILRQAGMKDGEETEEAWAYLQQSLLEESLRKIGKKHWT